MYVVYLKSMTIPSYGTFMLPLLKFSSDGKEFSNREAIDSMSKEFRITDEERYALQPNGNETIISNRVRWALFYLKRAMLLNSRKKGIYRITDRGIQVLRQNPTQIDTDLLKQFPEYIDFVNATRPKKELEIKYDVGNTINKTPEEMLEDSYQIIKDDVKSQLLDTVKRCSPMFFEKLVIELLISMGYGGSVLEAGKAIGRIGDEGVDGIIKEDILGLDTIYLQAKKWDATVGRPEIQKFAGALQGQRAKKGIFITTGKFSNDALDYINNIETKIVLIDGNQMAEYMTDHNVGVTDIKDYRIKKVNSDYFEEQI